MASPPTPRGRSTCASTRSCSRSRSWPQQPRGRAHAQRSESRRRRRCESSTRPSERLARHTSSRRAT
eukprot:7229858-Prymnesium_polylepis.1